MNNWKHYVDVSDIFHNDDFTVVAKSHGIAARIRNSDWYHNQFAWAGSKLADLLVELEGVTDAYHFDAVWDDIYDLADNERAMIETRTDHQNERPANTREPH